MKKETWQDAINEMDEKFAGEYAQILQKDEERKAAAPAKKRRPPKWTGWAVIAACLSLVLITAAATGAFKRESVPKDPTVPGSIEASIEKASASETSPGTQAADIGTPTTGQATDPAIIAEASTASNQQTSPTYYNQPMEQPMADTAFTAKIAERSGASYGFYGTEGESLPFPGWNTEEYAHIRENSFLSVKTSPFSTFAADVDTASYANLRRMIRAVWDIPEDAVRIEELINYFHYNYAEPKKGEPFGVTMEMADCPWNKEAKLLLIGLQAQKLDKDTLPPSNLVFLIDVSGSMNMPEKLPLAQRSFMTLAENLDQDDRITIITYSSGEKLVLDGVSGDQTARIMGALEELQAGGSTNGESALRMAYEAAEKHFIPGGNNRIILATDGDFNVGVTSEGELTRLVQSKAESGIFLSVLGYGMGNYKDNKMEAMADNGNGNYYYIDDIAEARKVLVEEAGGTLFTVAKDVKLQVEFNPAQVKGYRLIGYENRVMAAEDFADDTKDGGEIGAGHQVTALFEIIPAGSDFEIPEVESRYGQNEDPSTITADEWLVLNIRCKEPEGSESTLLSYPLALDAYSFKSDMSQDLSWAAGMAQWGMLLRDSEYKGTTSFDSLLERLEGLQSSGGTGMDDFRKECLELIRASRELLKGE